MTVPGSRTRLGLEVVIGALAQPLGGQSMIRLDERLAPV